eukprot:jgi/Tetstr1/434986/TSEL_023977.t1
MDGDVGRRRLVLASQWRLFPEREGQPAMRRCSSDPYLELHQADRVQQSSYIACPAGARERWKWAFRMTRRFCKGGSSNDGFVMLLPEHWLEARHPEHRSHLKPYFDHWVKSRTQQGFFYWLDQGEGKEVDLPERPRVQLEACRVRYCGPELALLEVCVEEGLLKYRIGKRLVDTPLEEGEPPCSDPFTCTATSGKPGEARPKSKWIYVLDVHNRFYINKKQAGEFHHTSFTRGGPVRAAGSIIVQQGVVRQITAWSGHYRPTEQDFDEVLVYLGSQGVDMSAVEKFLTKVKPGSKMALPVQAEAGLDVRRLSCPPPQIRDEALEGDTRAAGPGTRSGPGPGRRDPGTRPPQAAQISSVLLGGGGEPPPGIRRIQSSGALEQVGEAADGAGAGGGGGSSGGAAAAVGGGEDGGLRGAQRYGACAPLGSPPQLPVGTPL